MDRPVISDLVEPQEVVDRIHPSEGGEENPEQLGFRTRDHFQSVVGRKPHYSGCLGNVRVG
jgi:hypothetical protein